MTQTINVVSVEREESTTDQLAHHSTWCAACIFNSMPSWIPTVCDSMIYVPRERPTTTCSPCLQVEGLFAQCALCGSWIRYIPSRTP